MNKNSPKWQESKREGQPPLNKNSPKPSSKRHHVLSELSPLVGAPAEPSTGKHNHFHKKEGQENKVVTPPNVTKPEKKTS